MTTVVRGSRKTRPFILTRLFSTLVGLTALIVVFYGCLIFLDKNALPVTTVLVEGEFKYLDVTRVKTMVQDSIDGGILYVDIKKIRKKLLLEPWISDVQVRKVWPPGIKVKVTEKEVAARWGPDLLLSPDGAVFKPWPVKEFDDLVTLFSPYESPKVVIENFIYAKRALETCGIFIRSFIMSHRKEWVVLTADKKIINFGSDNIKRKIRRFTYAYRKGISEYWPQLAKVDLRYKNGISVSAILSEQTEEEKPDG